MAKKAVSAAASKKRRQAPQCPQGHQAQWAKLMNSKGGGGRLAWWCADCGVEV